MDNLNLLLQSVYGIKPVSISLARGGFSAKAAYRVVGDDSTEYFVKVYDKSLSTTSFYVERIDAYMPVLDWLSSSTGLRGRVLSPILTKNSEYKAEMGQDVYVVFLYVHGEAPGVTGVTQSQTVELAEILADLHELCHSMPFQAHGLEEDISLIFCDQLILSLHTGHKQHQKLYALVKPYSDMLWAAISELRLLRDTVRIGYSPLVLCHGDAHGNNIIQSDRLVLADWEDIRWAPAEADLFICGWHPYSDTLLKSYSAARHNYQINYKLLYFYSLRRRLEDVWVTIQRLTEESCDEGETERLLNRTQQGLEKLQMLYCYKK